MLYRLIMMRHAKSDWTTDAASDHDRPLNERGKRDAPRIATKLAELDWIPDHVVCSDARRTRETWARMVNAWPLERVENTVVDYEQKLYLAGLEDLVSVVGSLTDNPHCLLALGHNPGWEEITSWFCGNPQHMTTANAALLEIEAPTWRAAITTQGAWQLVHLLRPKELS
jgi:phosphohistidine phosphatase